MAKLRTNPTEVRKIIVVPDDADLNGVILSASLLTDQVESNDSAGILGVEMLTRIETWLAAHFYAIQDQQYMSEGQGKSNATFQTGQKGKGTFDINDYGRTAMGLDVTGYLAQINQNSIKGRGKFRMTWLGKTSSDV